MPRSILLCCWVALVIGPGAAQASWFDMYGFGTRGQAMGNALTAGSMDYHATYYNPADLLARKEVHLGIGLDYIEPLLRIDRDLASSPSASVIPDRNMGVHLGLSTPIGGVFDQRLAFGFALYVPVLKTTRVQFVDHARPQFYMHDNLPDKLLLAVGMAGEPFDWLRLGIGFQLLADLTGKADMRLSLIDGRFEQRHLSFDLHAGVAATAGISVVPMKGLTIGVSYRQELKLFFGLPVTALLTEVGTLSFEVSGTSLYTPHQINTGVSWRMPWVPLTLAADVTVALWSMAPSPVADLTLQIDGAEVTGSDEPILRATTPGVSLQAKDIAILRFGMEYEISDFAIRAGYAFRPTPIPEQAHRTNFGDTDAHMATFGASWTFKDPTRVHKRPLTIGLAIQATVLRPRRHQKVDPADTTGSWEMSGTLLSIGLDLQHDF